jgi:uncharacterized repeat protein (TIGR04052 family)
LEGETVRFALSVAALVCAISGLTFGARTEQEQQVRVAFALVAGGKATVCGVPLELGLPPVKATLREARFYIYGVKLIDAEGKRVPVRLDRNDWQYADVALLDFEAGRGERTSCSEASPPKNDVITGRIPVGTYGGLEFSVGVPVEGEVDGKKISLNHSDIYATPPPLDIARMSWSWRAGRRYVLVEVDPEGGLKRPNGSQARTWMVHLGATACKGNPATGEIVACERTNRFTVKFDRFDAGNDEIAIDISTLFKESNLARDGGGAVGCMSDPSDPECGQVFKTLGVGSTESAPSAGDAEPPAIPSTASIFNVRAKR